MTTNSGGYCAAMRIALAATCIATLSYAAPAIAAGSGVATKPPLHVAANATANYRFELAAPPKPVAGGRNIVTIRIVHADNGKPVAGAIIIQSRADMSPDGMAGMTAPIRALPVATLGVYPFEVQNGAGMATAGKWALTFAAKVQGEAATVRGTVVVELKP